MSVAGTGKIRYFSSTHLNWQIPQFSDVQKSSSRIWSPKFGYPDEKKVKVYTPPNWTAYFINTTYVRISLSDETNDKGNISCIRVGVTDESGMLINVCDCVWDDHDRVSFDGINLMKANILMDRQNGKIPGYLQLFCEIPKETCMQFDIAATQITAENDCDIIQQDLKKLLISEKDSDFTIKVKEREFHVHKVILRARSSVFDSMLSHDMKENKDGTINVEDCEPDVFAEFIHFVYSGKIENINSGNACSLYYTADKYNMQKLKKICVNFLKQSFSVENICEIVCLATKHCETDLLKCAVDYFAKNLDEILVTCNWLQFLKDNPVEANELYIKSLKIGYTRKR